MPIEVINIKNLFWTNGSYKVPNSIPSFAESTNIESSPIEIDYFTSRIDLWGEYNYAKFNGVYYFMQVSKIKDPIKKHYEYILTRDLWANILLKYVIKVKGTVIVWNKDELLEDNINRCYAEIQNPAELTYVNFKEKEFKWQDHLEAKGIINDIHQEVLSKQSFDWFKYRYNSELVRRYKIAKGYWYYNKPEIFIFGYLRGTKYKGWKHKARELINESIKEINKDSKRVLVKLQTPQVPQSPLIGSYAISYSDDSIGLHETKTIDVLNLDLSGVTDIKAIRWTDLKDTLPNKELNEQTGIFQVPEEYILNIPDTFCLKLSRKAYLPIISKWNKNIESVLKPQGDYVADFKKVAGWYTQPPQKINLKDNKGYGYLWWVDKIDFSLGWWGYLSFEESRSDAKWPNSSFPLITDNEYQDSHIKDKLREKNTYYGFILFQFIKEYDKWDRFEYIGDVPTNTIEVITGLNSEILNIYKEANKWWSNIGDRLQAIAGSDLFSKIHLDLNLFSWLYFSPKCYNYRYGYHWSNSYDHWSYVNNNYYTNLAVTSDIRGNNKFQLNPFNKDRIDTWKTERERKIKQITLSDIFNLPWDISKGDFLISNIEYEFRYYNYSNKWLADKSHYDNLDWSKVAAARDKGKTLLPSQAPSRTKRYSGAVDPTSKPVYAISTYQVENYIGDFITENVDKFNPEHLNNHIIICTNTKGDLVFRTFKTKNITHRLSTHSNQIVNDVDNKTAEEINYIHIGTSKNLPESADKDIEKSYIKNLLNIFYESIGIPVRSEQSRGQNILRFQWYNEEDFNSNTGILLELVGSSWYAFIRKNKVHFICNDLSKFKETETNIKKLETNDKLKNLSLLERINQLNILSIYNHSIKLQTKFNFNREETFSLNVSGYPATQAGTTLNNFLIRAKNNFDVITKWIQIAGKSLRGLQVADQINKDRLDLQIFRAEADREFAHERLNFSRKRFDIIQDRKIWDNNYMWYKQAANALADAFNFATGIPKWKVTGGLEQWKPNLDNSGISYPPPTLATSTAIIPTVNFTMPESNLSNPIPQAYPMLASALNPIGMAGKVIGAGLNTISTIMDLTIGHYERKRRIQEDRELGYKEFSFRNFEIDRSAQRAREDMELAINSLTNVYHRPEITDTDLVEEFNKKEGTENINIRVYTPTAEQLKILKAYRNFTGIRCNIPNAEQDIFNNMEPNIFQFKDIDSGHIEGIEDNIEKEWLRSRLIAGLCVIDTTEGNTIKQTPGDNHLKELLKKAKEDLETSKGVISRVRQEYNHKAEQLQQILHERNKLAEDKQALQDELNKRLTDYQVQQKIKEETNKVWKDAIANSRITFRQNAKLQSEIAGCKQKIKELEEQLKERERVQVIDVAPAVERIEPDNQELIELRNNLNICNNNLEALREANKNLEQEKTQQQNLATLYKAEADKFKAEAEQLRDYFTSDVLANVKDNSDYGIAGVGHNFGRALRHMYKIYPTIQTIITSHNNRWQHRGQTIANLGWYWNYMVADMLRTWNDKLGEPEKNFLNRKKFSEDWLRRIRG